MGKEGSAGSSGGRRRLSNKAADDPECSSESLSSKSKQDDAVLYSDEGYFELNSTKSYNSGDGGGGVETITQYLDNHDARREASGGISKFSTTTLFILSGATQLFLLTLQK